MLPIIVRRNDSNGNLGDTLIWHGLVNLLKDAGLQEPILYVDKFQQGDFNAKLPQIKTAGRIIFAGTPQYNSLADWKFWWDTTLWDQAKEHGFKAYSIAGGSGTIDPYESIDHYVQRLSSDALTDQYLRLRKEVSPTLTVRDRHADALLRKYGFGHELLPCTAAWSLEHMPSGDDRYLVLSLPGMSHYCPTDGKPSLEALLQKFRVIYVLATKMGLNPIYGIPGKDAAAKTLPYLQGARTFVPANIVEWKAFLSKATGAIACRIHAAIPMCYLNKRTVLLPIDTRYTAADIAGVTVLDINVSPEAILEVWKYAWPRGDLKAAHARYMQLLQVFLRPECASVSI